MTDDDTVTATAALRDLLAETEGARRGVFVVNGPLRAFNSSYARAECYEVADAMLPLFVVDWYYAATAHATAVFPESVHECDDLEDAREWKRDLGWDGPVVRQLGARLTSQTWQPVPGEADHG